MFHHFFGYTHSLEDQKPSMQSTLPPAQLLTPQQRHMVRLMPRHMLPSLALHLGCMEPQWHLHMERPWDMVPRWVGPRWDMVHQWEVMRVLPQYALCKRGSHHIYVFFSRWAMERPLNLAHLSSVTESSPIIRKSSGRTETKGLLSSHRQTVVRAPQIRH